MDWRRIFEFVIFLVESFSYPKVISTEDIEKDVIYVLTTLEDVEDEEEEEKLTQEN